MRREQWLEGWSKRDERRPVDMEATIYRTDGRKLPVRVANISFEGCMISCDEILAIGEKLTLTLPGLGDVSAQVRWFLNGSAGVYFLPEEADRIGRQGKMRA